MTREPRTIGLDVGGTNVKAVVAEGSPGRLAAVYKDIFPTPRTDGRVDTSTLLTYAIGLRDEWDAHNLGVAVAGVSNGKGIVQRAVNLGWHEEPIGPMFEAVFSSRVTILNDGQAAALAEVAMTADSDFETCLS